MPRTPDDDDAIGDAEILFRDDAAPRPPAARPVPVVPAVGDEYDLLGDDPADSANPVSPISPTFTQPPVARSKPKSSGRPRTVESDEEDFGPVSEGAHVDRPWTRLAEWGPDLRNLAIAGVSWVIVLYVAWNNGAGLGTLFVLFVLGAAGMLVLCYPLAITMERPVRMTPEQAVRDYFAALMHFRPHYRRMWLLLSSAGQDTAAYQDLPSFRARWQATLARLRGGEGRAPLLFKIQDFRSEKSAGKTALNAKFTVSARAGSELEGGRELGSYRMTIGLVRGPDKMWYLNDAAMPGESAR